MVFMESGQEKSKAPLIGVAIFFTASVLRAPITSLGALSLSVQADLGLSAAAMGLLTTLPLLIFAASSALMSAVSDKFGKKRVVSAGMGMVVLGIVLRSYGGDVGLFGGTVVLGAGISAGNVLLPAIIKECFPLRIGALTALYTTTMSIFAGGFAGACSPLMDAWGEWRMALVLIAPLACIAAVLWVISSASGNRHGLMSGAKEVARTPSERTLRVFHPRILRQPLTWWITLQFGLQSILFYCTVAWLPSILAARGISGGAVALCVALFPLMGIPCTMFLPPLAQRMRGQRGLGVGIGVLCTVGVALLWWAPTDGWSVFAVGFFGLALGAPFCLCMFYLGYRTVNADDAARLSGIVQTLGYLMAAVGPTCLGLIYDLSSSWGMAFGLLFILTCGLILSGWKTGSGMISQDR